MANICSSNAAASLSWADLIWKLYHIPSVPARLIRRQSHKATIQGLLNQNQTQLTPYSSTAEEHSIPDVLTERERIKNTALEQDILLKKDTLKKLFRFLGAETIVVFVFSFFQATHWLGFKLDEWSFKLLVSATLLQITYMLQVAVKHLFPNK